MKENKKKICEALLPVLKMTRNLYDLENLEFNPKTEIVTATFTNGYKKYANVCMDSGTSMIKDILNQIV